MDKKTVVRRIWQFEAFLLVTAILTLSLYVMRTQRAVQQLPSTSSTVDSLALTTDAPIQTPYPQVTAEVYTARAIDRLPIESIDASETAYLQIPRTLWAVPRFRVTSSITNTPANSATAERMATDYMGTVQKVFASLIPMTMTVYSAATPTELSSP